MKLEYNDVLFLFVIRYINRFLLLLSALTTSAFVA